MNSFSLSEQPSVLSRRHLTARFSSTHAWRGSVTGVGGVDGLGGAAEKRGWGVLVCGKAVGTFKPSKSRGPE
jgi:hypothetical protein